jgi:ankyrin repeat protein
MTRKHVWEVGATTGLLLAVAIAVGGFFYWRERQRRLDAEVALILSEASLSRAAETSDRLLTLVRQGASVHARGKHGATVLLQAASIRNLALVEAALVRGTNVNAAADNGITPLMGAAISGDVECVRRLLEHGAEVNRQDDAGYTALRYAQQCEWMLEDARGPAFSAIIRLLKQHGAKE